MRVSCTVAEIRTKPGAGTMEVDESATIPLPELLDLLKGAGIPYDDQDEAAARAAYAKVYSLFGKRICVGRDH